jgi:predicted  nucleic acid-binding Zn-ribbon protein
MLESSLELERGRMENDVDELNSRLSTWDERFNRIEQKLVEHDRRFDAIEGHFPDLHAYIAFSFSETSRQIKDLSDQTKDLGRQTAALGDQTKDLGRQTTELREQTTDLGRQTTELREQTTDLGRQTTEISRQMKEGFSESRAGLHRLETKVDKLIEASRGG